MPGIVGIFKRNEFIDGEFHVAATKLQRKDWLKVHSASCGDGKVGIVGVPTLLQRNPLHQDSDGNVSILNGYISNPEVLLQQLNLDKDCADSKILATAYQKWGVGCLKHLDGCYNGIIYDRKTNSVILFNDRFGNYHIYYHHDPQVGSFTCGPELKIFRGCNWIRREPCWHAISDFLTFGQPWGDKTFLKDVYLLDPASYVCFSERGLEKARYWRIPYRTRVEENMSAEHLSAELDGVLENSFTSVASRPGRKGLFLSAGFDSRMIACYLTRHKVPFTSLAMHHEDRPALDSIVSPRIAEHLGSKWEAISYRIRDPHKLLEEQLTILDGTWPCSYFPHALPNEDLRNRFDLIINGNNGNQLFGDYATSFFQVMKDTLEGGVLVDTFERVGADGLYRSLIYMRLSQAFSAFQPLLSDDFCKMVQQNSGQSFNKAYDSRPDIVGFDKYEYIALTESSRRWGVFNIELLDYYEQTNPFYDNRNIIEFTSSLPFAWKFSRLLDANNLFRRFPQVARLPKISGYPSLLRYPENVVPPGKQVDDYYDAQHIFTELLPNTIDEIITDQSFTAREWIKADQVQQNWHAHKSGQLRFVSQIANLISLDYFFRTFIE